MIDDTSESPYNLTTVAGIDYSLLFPKVTAVMSKKRKITKESKIKSPKNVYNYSHLMPTKHSVGIRLHKTVFNKDAF